MTFAEFQATRRDTTDPPYSTCMHCDETFAVTQAMITEHRDASGYDGATDDEIANIIEVCPTCAGIEPEAEATDRELVIAALEMLSSDNDPICARRDDLLRRLRAGV